jgi:hypothetical protein
VIYTHERLHVTDTGTHQTPPPAEDAAYRFRYTGGLMTRIGDWYFFVSECWTRDREMINPLRRSEAYLYEFVRLTSS